MAVEIERKYLLRGLPRMPAADDVLEVDQGYIPGVNVRERVRRQTSRSGTTRYFRTIKMGAGVERTELEDETDERTFNQMWPLTEGRRVRKRRHLVRNGTDVWEIDEFLDRTLVLAELELEHADEAITMPDWLRAVLEREVTNEPNYTNRSLAR
jgi:adenylate cyclase